MAELLGSLLTRIIAGGPDKPPQPPRIEKVPIPALAKKPKEPGVVPGINDKQMGAGAMDEKRRIMGGLPKPTQNEFAGASMEPIKKKKLLGDGLTGNLTTGA